MKCRAVARATAYANVVLSGTFHVRLALKLGKFCSGPVLAETCPGMYSGASEISRIDTWC